MSTFFLLGWVLAAVCLVVTPGVQALMSPSKRRRGEAFRHFRSNLAWAAGSVSVAGLVAGALEVLPLR